MASVAEIEIGASPEAWIEAGFAVSDGATTTGGVKLSLEPGESGIHGWTLRGAGSPELDGLPTNLAEDVDPVAAAEHRNGVTQIDHVVVFTPELERTTAALEASGIECRRVREAEAGGGRLRQGFFRLGEVILEVVEHANVPDGPASFWGITFTVADLDATAGLLGDKLGSIRDAVQPGRRIATFRSGTGLGMPVALITPEPAR